MIAHGSEGKEFTLHMPLKDKKRLTYLFQSMVVWDSAGYTLLGNKPMSLTSVYRPFSFVGWEIFMASVKPGNLRKYFAWKTWEKYQHLLENSKFLMWAEENLFFDNPNYTNPSVFILFVHQHNLEKIVGLYESDFQEGLKRRDISGKQLLLEARDRPFLKTVLGGNEQLIGTLLGYGRDNARLFVERKNGKETPLTFIWDERVWGKEIDNIFKNRPYFSWAYLGICPDNISTVLGYPTFLVDQNSIETQRIQSEFMEVREKIINHYKGKEFLEATLELLLQGS